VSGQQGKDGLADLDTTVKWGGGTDGPKSPLMSIYKVLLSEEGPKQKCGFAVLEEAARSGTARQGSLLRVRTAPKISPVEGKA